MNDVLKLLKSIVDDPQLILDFAPTNCLYVYIKHSYSYIDDVQYITVSDSKTVPIDYYRSYDCLKYDELYRAVKRVNYNYLYVGNSVKFEKDKNFIWKVRCVDENYAILTSTHHYIVLDFILNVKGYCSNLSLCADTNDDIKYMMDALHDRNIDNVVEWELMDCKSIDIKDVKRIFV